MQEVDVLKLDVPRLCDRTLQQSVEEVRVKPFSDLNKIKRVAFDADTFKPRVEQLKQQYDASEIAALKYDTRPFNDYILMQNKDVQPPSSLPN